MNGAAELVAVEVDAGASFAAGRQDVLFSVSDYVRQRTYAQYDVSLDDQRFIMRQTGEAATTELIWVENWVEELERRTGN